MTSDSQSFVLGDRFTIRLRMLSDWHVGTGTGIPGSIDALIARDREGFPCVPAKTIVGMWRDALETLTLGLPVGKANAWPNWTEVIFGSQPNVDKIPEVRPRPAVLALRPARLSENLRERIKTTGDVRLQQALTFLKPEIKIDEHSGTAETNMLRSAEMGRIDTILETDCELCLDRIAFDGNAAIAQRQKETISALLIASAKLVERIGGKRRRGSGKCELSIIGKENALSGVVEYLKAPAASNPPTITEQTHNHDFATAGSDSSWQKLEYTLTLKTPVSIVTATLGNVSETLDFIPGTYLLPHITKGRDLFKHVANGDFQVSPATIQVNGKRGLPVPKFLSAHKVAGGFDKARTVLNRLKDVVNENTPQLKPFRDGYVDELDEEKQLPHYKATKRTLLTHNTVEDEVQRPTQNVGGVYSREAIAAGTTLGGEIRYKSPLDAQLMTLAGSTSNIRLGTSKKDDYGLAELTIVRTKDKSNPTEDVTSNQQGTLTDGHLIIYFESDVLLRTANLRQTTLVDDLKEYLERQLSMGLNRSVSLTKLESLIHIRRIESWHEGWGLPRPTLIAMQAGSCAQFDVAYFDQITDAEKAILNKNLQALEDSGIGERRGEGYGRIRFNPKILREAINDWAPANETASGDAAVPKAKSNTSESLKGATKEFAEQIETTAWREELHRAVLLIADDKDQRLRIFGFEKGGRPSMSQIGGLRSVISRLREFEDRKHVASWLTHLEQTENRLDRWAQNKQAAEAKLGRIKDLLIQDSKVWLILCEAKTNGRNVWQSPPTLVRTKEALQKELWAEAIRALFDACARAHKREGGGN